MDDLLDTALGPYTIIAKIAEGGMGVVYKGFQKSLNRHVAIKVLRPEHTSDQQFIARFRREALSVAQLSHPGILSIYDFCVTRGRHYIVMEYVDGGSLKDLLARGSLPVEEAVRIASQMADALDYAHKQGVVHRDVKPANILLTRSGRPLLTDFGIAQALYEATPLTRPGASIGTPAYMAPEQAEGGSTDGRTDIYALGIVLYEMLAGRPPFQADVPLATLYQQVNESPLSVRQQQPQVPRWLEAVVHRALAKCPQDRYQTAGGFATALREQRAPSTTRRGRLAGSTVPPTPIRSAANGQRARPVQSGRTVQVLLLALLFVLLATIGGGAYLLATDDDHKTTPPVLARASETPMLTALAPTATQTPEPPPDVETLPPAETDSPSLPTPTPRQTRTRTPTATRTPIVTRTPTRTPTRVTPRPGEITDMEYFGAWQRGDEPNGTFTQSAAQKVQGSYSGRLDYDFPSPTNDYVVFKQRHSIALEPSQVSAWVYGDGSGHFLNVWILDSQGQTWQIPLGRVTHTGWQQMAGTLDVNQPWPWAHISGPDNNAIDYPVSFQALILDDNPDAYAGRGTLYIDDLRAGYQAEATTAGNTTPSPSITATSAPPAATTGPKGRIVFAAYNPGIGSYTLYTVRPDGSELHAIADYAHQPNMSPNGERVIVKCVGGGRDDLWSLRVDGTDWQQLTTHTDDRFPSWSPNSLIIGYASSRQGDGLFRLYTRDSLVTTDITSFVLGQYPIWADTWEIVYSGCDYGWGTGANCGLWRAINGRRPAAMTYNPADIPTDANATEILFLRPEDNNWEIYRMPLTGGSAVPLTGSSGNDGPAAFSPDGQSVAFLSTRSGAWALYTMSRTGSDVRKVIDLPNSAGYGAAPHPWTDQRISWGPLPVQPTPIVTPDSGLLPAPRITFPIPDDTVSSTKSTVITWSWSQQLASNQGYQVRIWYATTSTPLGVAPPTTQTQLEVHFGLTDAFRQYGEGTYYLDVVVVQISPYRILSSSAPIRIKTDPDK